MILLITVVRVCAGLALLSEPEACTTAIEIRKASVSAQSLIKRGHVEYVTEVERLRTSTTTTNSVLRQAFREHPEQRHAAERQLTINASRRERVSVYFDVDRNEWRLTSKDLRDLDTIMIQENITSSHRRALDTSKEILDGSGITAEFFPSTRRMLVINNPPVPMLSSPVFRSPIKFGLLPEAVFGEASTWNSIEITQSDERMVRVTLYSSDRKSVLLLDPDNAFRFQSAKLFSQAGVLLLDETYGDYRVVNTIPFPFRYERSDYGLDGSLRQHEKYVVEKAVFNEELPDSAFKLSLTSDTKVVSLHGDYHFMIAGRQLVGVDNLVWHVNKNKMKTDRSGQ